MATTQVRSLSYLTVVAANGARLDALVEPQGAARAELRGTTVSSFASVGILNSVALRGRRGPAVPTTGYRDSMSRLPGGLGAVATTWGSQSRRPPPGGLRAVARLRQGVGSDSVGFRSPRKRFCCNAASASLS